MWVGVNLEVLDQFGQVVLKNLCATCLANKGKITVRITIHKDVSALIPETCLISSVTLSSQNSLQYRIIFISFIIHLYSSMYMHV